MTEINPNPPETAAEPVKKGKEVKPPKPKLSKAQRKLLKKLEAIALQKRLIRERFLREITLANKTLKRGKIAWEDIIRPIRLTELRHEIEEWAEKSEFLLWKKDEKIGSLLKNIDETSEIHEKAFSKHVDHLNYLSRCHAALMGNAQDNYENNALDLLTDFLLEFENSQKLIGRNAENAENIMHTANVVTKDRLKENYERFMVKKFDKVATEIEIRYILRDDTAKKMRELQDQLLLWIKILQGDMVDAGKTKKFLYFMERQRNYVKESERLNEIEVYVQRRIESLKRELLNIETESNKRILELKLQQAYFFEVKSNIKSGIERNKVLTHEKLRDVASASYDVVKKLKEIVKRGELLLNLGACCRKYQTEKEKIYPITEEILDPLTFHTEFLFDFKFDMVKYFDISPEELAEQMGFMKNFWHRVSNAGYHILLLKQEKEKLIQENENYQNIIRSLKKSDDTDYILEAMSVNKPAGNYINPRE